MRVRGGQEDGDKRRGVEMEDENMIRRRGRELKGREGSSR
jgi:hypothetical protein